MPGNLVNGILEAFGIGDIFLDLTQTPAWKSFAAVTAFKGPIQGLVEGKLGIQQPGWRPDRRAARADDQLADRHEHQPQRAGRVRPGRGAGAERADAGAGGLEGGAHRPGAPLRRCWRQDNGMHAVRVPTA